MNNRFIIVQENGAWVARLTHDRQMLGYVNGTTKKAKEELQKQIEQRGGVYVKG